MNRRSELFRQFLGKASDDSLLLQDFFGPQFLSLAKFLHEVLRYLPFFPSFLILITSENLSAFCRCSPNLNRGQKINANFFCTNFFNNPSGHGRPRRKSWTSAPKSAFSCGPGGGEKLFDPWASGRKGQECLREIRTKKFMFMLCFLPRLNRRNPQGDSKKGDGKRSVINSRKLSPTTL